MTLSSPPSAKTPALEVLGDWLRDRGASEGIAARVAAGRAYLPDVARRLEGQIPGVWEACQALGILTPEQRAVKVERCLAAPPGSTLERLLAEEAHRDFASFVQQCWHVLEPGTPLEWNWFLELICRELEAVTAGETRNLVVCLPPGFAKSLLVSVFWPAWWWLRDPRKRILTVANIESLAIRDNRRMREVIESDWYGRLADDLARREVVADWSLAKDQNEKRNFENTHRGVRQCYAMTGGLTGHRGNGLVIDDPHQFGDVLGDAGAVRERMDAAWHRVSVGLPSRVNDQRVSFRVVVQQRLDEHDVAGRIIAEGKARKVVLPMRAYEMDDPDRHPDDPREPGELLDPVRFPEVEVQRLEQQLDEIPGQASAQLQQRPRPPRGNLFRAEYTSHRYDFDPQRPTTRFPQVVVTVDATFKDTQAGSFVSMQAWGVRGVERYLLGEVHERMDFVATEDALVSFCAIWRPNAVLIEEKANGAALISRLKKRIQGIIAILPDKNGDKMTRAQNALPAWAAGNVFLPSSEYMPTVGDFIAELRAFPRGPNDRVDAMSQLFLWLDQNQASSMGTFNAALRGAIGRR